MKQKRLEIEKVKRLVILKQKVKPMLTDWLMVKHLVILKPMLTDWLMEIQMPKEIVKDLLKEIRMQRVIQMLMGFGMD